MLFPRKKKVLVLEDEKTLSKALAIKLENEGFQTTVVENGEEAIHEFDSGVFDLALLDLVVPRIDGFGVLEHIRKTNQTMPVFVLSNLSQKEDMERAFDLGANRYFVKSNTSLTFVLEEIKKDLET